MHNIRFSYSSDRVYAWLDGEEVYLCAMPNEAAAKAKVEELRLTMKRGKLSATPEYRRIFES